MDDMSEIKFSESSIPTWAKWLERFNIIAKKRGEKDSLKIKNIHPPTQQGLQTPFEKFNISSPINQSY